MLLFLINALLCTFCRIESETVNNLFYECFLSLFRKSDLNDFASFWSLVSGKRVDLTLRDVSQGKLDSEVEILNIVITLVKLYIWISRKRGVIPNLSAFKEIQC